MKQSNLHPKHFSAMSKERLNQWTIENFQGLLNISLDTDMAQVDSWGEILGIGNFQEDKRRRNDFVFQIAYLDQRKKQTMDSSSFVQ